MKQTTFTSKARVIRRPFTSFAAAAILVSLISLWSGQNARATIFTLSIPDGQPWTDTGINVAAGSELEVSASGTVTFGFSQGQSTGPNGLSQQFLPNTVVPSALLVSLIGKTGGTTAVGNGTPVPEGTPGDGAGFVGASYDKIISTGGELFLGFNDQVGGFSDNNGSFSVTVTVVPEPSVAAFFGMGAGMLLWRRMRKVSI